MRWCRIRLVLLGLLLCVVHVVSGTCGQNFSDPASSALLADVVIEGKVRSISDPDQEGTFNITVTVKKNILKGGALINRGRPPKTLTIDRFKSGAKDKVLCLANVQKGRTYVFFLKDVQDKKGLYFTIMALPVKKSKKLLTEVKSVLCDNCAKRPNISELNVPGRATTAGGNISLNCSVEANPLGTFSWYKDGVLITKRHPRYQVSSKKHRSTLRIGNSVVNDTGEFECAVRNLLGEDRQSRQLTVVYPYQAEPCEIQTFCLNGGTCMIIKALSIMFCQCPEPWAGRRCEQLDGIRVSDDYNRQASLLLERTLIIIGIVIAVLVFIIICMVSYVLAKRARQQFQQRCKRRQQAKTPVIGVDSRSMSQPATNKPESLIKSQVLPSNMATKQPHQIILQDSSSPPASQSPREHFGESSPASQLPRGHFGESPPASQLPRGHFGDSPQQTLHSNTNANSSETRNEPRGRLAASSVYDNFRSAELSHFSEGGKLHSTEATPNESVEVEALSVNGKAEMKRPQPEKSSVADILNTSNKATTPVNISVLQGVHAPDAPPALPLYRHVNETAPLERFISSSSQPSAPSQNSPSTGSPQRSPHVFSLNGNDPVVQPLIANEKKHLPMSSHVQPQRPYESKSDKDLSRYLPLGGRRQGPNEMHGYRKDNSEHNHLLRDLSKLSHSSTFPKPKLNGMSSDALSESDEEGTSKVPYAQPLDLYISEDDLCLSKETLVNSSFSSVSGPSRQASHDGPGLGLMRHPAPNRPGIRKHQSEESPNYSKIVNKNHAFLQDNARTRSLDNPPGRANVNPDPWRLNSTVAGSPDVETYDNIVQQPASQLHNHMYAYDPNDDSAPWDGEMSRPDQSSSLTEEDRDQLTRLKDVLPDQQAIPI